MNKKSDMAKVKQKKLLDKLLSDFDTARDFARAINADAADVSRWRSGSHKVQPKYVIEICRIYPSIMPHELNPYVFDKDVRVTFDK